MSNRIGLRQLRAFHAVMVDGSITAAAERLNLTQPAISKQLTALEHAVGLKLFNRKSGAAVTPSQDGIAFFKATEATISGLEDLPTVAREILEKGQKRLRIAATPPLMNSAPFISALSAFRAQLPDVHLVLEARSRLDIEDWVSRRHIDIAFALLPGNNPNLTALPIVETRAIALLPKGHSLAEEEVITPDLIQNETVILPSRQPLRTSIDMELARADVALAPAIETSSAITCCRMVASGLGVGICDPFSGTAFLEDSLLEKPWAPEVKLVYGAFLPSSGERDPATQTLLDLALRFFTKMT